MDKATEARDKLCPMINAMCKADKCMAWRWATVKELGEAISLRIELDDGNASSVTEFVAEWPNSDRKPEGYCGLAGLPRCAN